MIRRSAFPHVRAHATLFVLAVGGLALTGCDLVLGLDKYSEGPATGGAGGGASTSSSSSTESASSSGSGSMSTGSSSSTGMFCEPNTSMNCYTGLPATTENVGDCRSGTAICDMDGGAYGKCTGEVVPAAVDDYPKKGDENCDGSPTSDTLWVSTFNSDGILFAQATAADGSGNTLVGGFFTGSVKFGATTLIADGADGFLTKLDAVGNPMWAVQLTGAMLQHVYGVATDSAGNVVITGTSESPFTIGSTSLPAGLFVAKYTAAGTLSWGRGCGGGIGGLSTIAVVPGDEIVMAGNIYGTATCGGTFTGSQGITLVKFAPSGTVMWGKGFIGGVPTTAAVVADPVGNIWLGGGLGGPINFGQSLSGSSYLVKFTPTGGYILGHAFQGAFLTTLDVDSLGGPVVGLQADLENAGIFDLGGVAYSGPAVARFNSAGVVQWGVPLGSGYYLPYFNLVLDATDHGWVVGSFDSATLALPGAVLSRNGLMDGFAWRFDPQGSTVYVKQYAGAAPATDQIRLFHGRPGAGNGDLPVAGAFSGSGDFGGGPISSVGPAANLVVFNVAH